MALTDKLSAIANAIRAKTGKTDPMTLDAMPTEIEGISVGGSGEELKITDVRYLFYCGARANIADVLISALAPDIKSFDHMFYAADNTSILAVPKFITSAGVSFRGMFYAVSTDVVWSAIKFVLDTSKATCLSSMFSNCYRLTTIPALDTSNCTDASSMFSSCSVITELPELNTSKVKDFQNMFKSCSALHTIPKLDMKSGTSFYNCFSMCYQLKNLYLYNISQSVQIGSGTSWGHLLTVDSLVHTIKELCTVTSTQKLTIGSANLEKIANLYCKITDDTNEKKPMELCESTDEGAMTLSDYVAEKGWQIL